MTRDEKRAEWAGVIELWRESGLGKAAFCRGYGVKSWQFHYWCRHLEADGDSGPAAEPGGFVALHFSDEAGDGGSVLSRTDGEMTGSGLTLVLRGARVELAADFDEASLARVLRVLEQHGADAC